MGTPSMLPENPLLAQIRQQARQSLQPDTPPPALMPPPGMNTPPPIMQTPQPQVQAPRGTLTGEQNERNRLISSKPGLEQGYNRITNSSFGQNHPLAGKLLGGVTQGLGTLANVGIAEAAPQVASLIPGTSAHHSALINREDRSINQMQSEEEKTAQTKNFELQPQLRLATQALANQKQTLANEKQDETEQHHKQQIEEQLRAHNYKTDETGKIIPLTYEEMSPQAQAVTDLKGSQEELAEASAALKKAQGDPNSPQYRMAMQRLEGAQQARAIALRRLNLSEDTFNARYHGTDNQGNALPGAMLTDEGAPVGSSFSANVRPTGTERNKGDMAISAREQLSDIKDIVKNHPTLFGPGYGQTTAFRQWLGSGDPDAQRFVAARTIAGDHLAGTFGGRSEAALDALDKAIGEFKTNPRAMEAGLDQLLKANSVFEGKGHVRTSGSAPQDTSEQSLGKTSKPDGTYEMNGKHYRVKGGEVYAH